MGGGAGGADGKTYVKSEREMLVRFKRQLALCKLRRIGPTSERERLARVEFVKRKSEKTDSE